MSSISSEKTIDSVFINWHDKKMSQNVLFVDISASADHQLPEWPSVLKFDKFGQTDYLTAHFPERSDFDLITGNG